LGETFLFQYESNSSWKSDFEVPSNISSVDFIFHVPGLKPPPLGGQLLA
jgi:hypothetical protein